MKRTLYAALIVLLLLPAARSEKPEWRQATDAELASLLPARAPVEKEHIETEMRTASGIVNGSGRYIAGSGADYGGLLGGRQVFALPGGAGARCGLAASRCKPGEYAFGYSHDGEVLRVHFNDAATGSFVGTTDARLLDGIKGVESLHIWPPGTGGDSDRAVCDSV